MNASLILLRCCEVGVSISYLDLFTIGVVLNMWAESLAMIVRQCPMGTIWIRMEIEAINGYLLIVLRL